MWVKCKANGQASIANYKGRGNGFDVSTGKQRMLYSAVETLATTVEAQQGFASVASTGDGWVEFIPVGSYTSGTFTLPDSKSLSDLLEIKMTVQTDASAMRTTIVNAEDVNAGSVFPSNFRIGFTSMDAGNDRADLIGSTTTMAATGTGANRVISAFVKYK